MLNPSIGKLLDAYESRYQLVIDLAKYAREIAVREDDEANNQKNIDKALDKLADYVACNA